MNVKDKLRKLCMAVAVVGFSIHFHICLVRSKKTTTY